ncbi:MAG: hypothetical protein EA414_18780 [Arthrospira sp. PLM2.Bin9]|nr:hypothetical protein [Arthrospira sp. PLM2.Bin9]TVU52213.1 MAG: hypothetical protein EA414_18780 [Arthrospira sp. PLM2.Bin9]
MKFYVTHHKNQSKPQLPFKESEFKNLDDFITYCSIFDPTILTRSGRIIDQTQLLFGNKFIDDFIVELFNDYSDIDCEIYSLIESLEAVVFLCCAPFYCQKPKEYSLKIVEQRFSKKNRVNTSWEKLRKSQIHSLKIYACWQGSFNNERFQRWLILKAPTINNIEYSTAKDMMGYGTTLPEADLEFHKARIKAFTNSQRIINYFVEQKTPLTKQRMFDVCKEIDPDINPNTVTFVYNEFSHIESSDFQLSCKSKIHKFTINVCGENITWEVIRYLAIEDDISPVNLQFFGEGETLKEAFDMCESQYQECINNDKFLRKMIDSKQAEILQEQIMREAREGEDFLNDLIEEFGDDIFPDRD